MKILINRKFGGFGFSDTALQQMYEAGIAGINKTEDGYIWCDPFIFMRNDQNAIEIVEQIGINEASGDCCKLVVVEIPDQVKQWDIVPADSGFEHLVYGDYVWYDED